MANEDNSKKQKISEEEMTLLKSGIERLENVIKQLSFAIYNFRDLQDKYQWDTEVFELERAMVFIASAFAEHNSDSRKYET